MSADDNDRFAGIFNTGAADRPIDSDKVALGDLVQLARSIGVDKVAVLLDRASAAGTAQSGRGHALFVRMVAVLAQLDAERPTDVFDAQAAVLAKHLAQFGLVIWDESSRPIAPDTLQLGWGRATLTSDGAATLADLKGHGQVLPPPALLLVGRDARAWVLDEERPGMFKTADGAFHLLLIEDGWMIVDAKREEQPLGPFGDPTDAGVPEMLAEQAEEAVIAAMVARMEAGEGVTVSLTGPLGAAVSGRDE